MLSGQPEIIIGHLYEQPHIAKLAPNIIASSAVDRSVIEDRKLCAAEETNGSRLEICLARQTRNDCSTVRVCEQFHAETINSRSRARKWPRSEDSKQLLLLQNAQSSIQRCLGPSETHVLVLQRSHPRRRIRERTP